MSILGDRRDTYSRYTEIFQMEKLCNFCGHLAGQVTEQRQQKFRFLPHDEFGIKETVPRKLFIGQ